MTKRTGEVAVIGGGIIGLMCAWRLAQHGADVHLYERNQFGQEASRAAAGMLAAQCEAAAHPPHDTMGQAAHQALVDLCLQSRALYAPLATQLLHETGIDIELSLCNAPTHDARDPGILFVDKGNDPAFLAFEAQQRCGMRVEATHFNEHQAYWLPDEGQVENRQMIRALLVACKQAGVRLQEHTTLNLDEAQRQFESILICGGAWSGEIMGSKSIAVHPVAGEVLAARPTTPLPRLIYSRDVYLVPRRDGRVFIGATMTERGFDQTLTQVARQRLMHAACDLLPEAAHWTIEDHWSGLRPATPDDLPLLGRTTLPDVYAATGHFRNGILLAPITAQLMTDCIIKNIEPPAAFAVDRFRGVAS